MVLPSNDASPPKGKVAGKEDGERMTECSKTEEGAIESSATTVVNTPSPQQNNTGSRLAAGKESQQIGIGEMAAESVFSNRPRRAIHGMGTASSDAYYPPPLTPLVGSTDVTEDASSTKQLCDQTTPNTQLPSTFVPPASGYHTAFVSSFPNVGTQPLQELMAQMMLNGGGVFPPSMGGAAAASNTPFSYPMPMLADPNNLAALAHFQQLMLAAQLGYPSIYAPAMVAAYGGVGGGGGGWNPSSVDPQNLLDHRVYRSQMDPSCTWSGTMPPRNYKNPQFCCKVFIGGVPWDVKQESLIDAFSPFGSCRVEWPGKEPRYYRSPAKEPVAKVTGYVYMIFEKEASVKKLLQNCTPGFTSAGEWYFKLSAKRQRTKEIRQVQVIPWVLADSSWTSNSTHEKLEPKKTVFVGALHGMITAEILATIFKDLFGNVIYASIDTDRHKYPIGSGRVTFSNERSYMKAILAAFIEIKTAKFTKKIQIDPFLEDAICGVCRQQPGPYFCREMCCFKYFCRRCWQCHSPPSLREHKPLMRNVRRRTTSVSTSSAAGSHFDDGGAASTDDVGTSRQRSDKL